MTTVPSARALWGRIETWLAANAPPLAIALRPGASENALADAQARMGLTLPDAVCDVYRVHDGGGFLDFVESEMLPIHQAVQSRQLMNDIGWGRDPDLPNEGESRGPVKPMWWNHRWIPFVGSGNMLCIDLDPASGGEVGQVVEVLKESARRTVLFPSITAWLEHWVRRFESGSLYFDLDRDELVAVAEDTRARHDASIAHRPSDAMLLLRALLEARALEAPQSAVLVEGIERIVHRVRGKKARARALERLFLDSDDVAELFWDSERIALFLDDW